MMPQSDPRCAVQVIAAAASDLNEEAMIILNSVDDDQWLVGDAQDRRAYISAAAQRCAWIAAGLLRYAERRGAKPQSAPSGALTNA